MTLIIRYMLKTAIIFKRIKAGRYIILKKCSETDNPEDVKLQGRIQRGFVGGLGKPQLDSKFYFQGKFLINDPFGIAYLPSFL